MYVMTCAGLHLIALLIFVTKATCEPPVLILSENLEQVLTSSTLQWMNGGKHNKHYDNAVVGAFQITPEEPAEENDAVDSVSSRPVYVCRARPNGIWVSGQLRPDEPNKCVISLHGKVIHVDLFEILINLEGAARLSWVRRSKYTINPQGAVTGGDEPFRNFIARRSAENDMEREDALTHYLGKLDPSDNLGKFTVVNRQDEELEFEDGEVLVETEPIRYEITKIELDLLRQRYAPQPRILKQLVLKNENENGGVARVDTVASYSYNYSLYWGHGHGLLTGLPFTVKYDNGSNQQGAWGIKERTEKVELASVEAYLAPGTAVNVTLRGNYTESDAPFNATIVAIYKDGEKKERLIKDSRRENTMRDVLPEFGPVYFLHNHTFVPTTTTTTTTTTPASTTTKATVATTLTTSTTTTEEARPVTPPEIIGLPDVKENLIPENTAPDKNMMSDDGDALSLKKKEASVRQNENSVGTTVSGVWMLVVALTVTVIRVT